MALIRSNNISLGYEGHILVENLNFGINEGDYLCIVGENGSGKSTLMRTMLGLQKPLSGAIEFGDGLKQTEIGYLPQQTVVQKDFPASVREIVLSGCQGSCGLRPFYNKKEKLMAKRNIERMGLSALEGRCYREMSGGQQQRVLLARALCATDKLIVLDEPVSGLDPKVTQEMYDLIADLNKKDGISVVMVSHDVSAALRYADHILYMENDYFFGTKEEFLESKVGRRFASFEGGEM